MRKAKPLRGPLPVEDDTREGGEPPFGSDDLILERIAPLALTNLRRCRGEYNAAPPRRRATVRRQIVHLWDRSFHPALISCNTTADDVWRGETRLGLVAGARWRSSR